MRVEELGQLDKDFTGTHRIVGTVRGVLLGE